MAMLTLQEQAARMTMEALVSLFRAARHVPEDKRDWSPGGAARSVNAQLAECAVSPELQSKLINGEPEESIVAAYHENVEKMKELEQLPFDDLYEISRFNYEALCEIIRLVLDDDLEDRFSLPFNGGMNPTRADLIFVPYWNLVYHTGQINYIQTLLGDTEMRM
jgi:uncharacterized damage-inducible protein DinB